MASSPFEPFLQRQKVVVLDGGLTTSLPNGAEKHHLWGHQLLYGLDGGLDALYTTHYKMLAQGADCIGSLTYKLSHELIADCRARGMLKGVEDSEGQRAVSVEELYSRAVGQAKRARDEFWAACRRQGGGGEGAAQRPLRPLVFASCGPFGDATKLFTGQTDPDTAHFEKELEKMRQYYGRKLACIADCAPDGVAIETLPGRDEAVVAAQALRGVREARARGAGEQGVPGWVTFICKDGAHTNNGDLLEDCVRVLATEYTDVLVGVGVNCVHPKFAKELLGTCKRVVAEAAAARGCASQRLAVIVYPNSGEVWDAAEGSRRWHGRADEDAVPVLGGRHAAEFRGFGADLIGGCCRVTADQIGLFRNSLLGGKAAAAAVISGPNDSPCPTTASCPSPAPP